MAVTAPGPLLTSLGAVEGLVVLHGVDHALVPASDARADLTSALGPPWSPSAERKVSAACRPSIASSFCWSHALHPDHELRGGLLRGDRVRRGRAMAIRAPAATPIVRARTIASTTGAT